MTGETPLPSGVSLEPGQALGAGAGVDLGRLVADLRALGLRRGQHLLVHSALSAIGFVNGGPATLLQALQEVVGPAATIVVPTQTPWTSRTSRAFRAATEGLDQNGIDKYAAALPVFDPETTPSHGMGKFAEYVRTRPEARRSAHPQTSFAALGPDAAACTAEHDADCHLGERSPLRWLYDADAAILLIGVGYRACTAFHLAEYRIRSAPVQGSELDDGDFARLGEALEAEWLNRTDLVNQDPAATPYCGSIGIAQSKRVPLRTAVDFAVSWMAKHRSGAVYDK
jgi:aminoglycoside 3-N-acetyltransferase